MRVIRTELEERMRRSEYYRTRYATDPVYRLKQLNKVRKSKGMSMLSSLEESKPRARMPL